MWATHLILGPERHGVVVHALSLAAAYPPLGAITIHTASLEGAGPMGPVLLPVTDRLLGATPEAAADAVEALGERVPLVLALHDIPQPQEGQAWFERRRAAYRRFADVARRVVVASRFERDLLLGLLDEASARRLEPLVRVVPLPLERRSRRRVAAPAAEVAVLGFLYPGKGVEDVIDAVSGSATLPRVVTNYGAVAAGHEDLPEAVSRYAAERGVEFRLTGYLPDDALDQALVRAGTPVAPHRHISASGSIGTWIAAGRRPVVRDGGWVRELGDRLPGTVTIASPTTGLTAALEAAAADPAATWLADDVTVGPSWAEAARAHLDVLAELT